jgi:hypothetical protein
MATSLTPRYQLKKYSSGGDPHPSRVEFNAMIDTLENNAAMFSQGPTGSRPAAGKRGREYWDETAKRKYYDDGASWQDTNPNGGGGAGTPIDPGAAAVEGVSSRAARADHTHKLALSTATVDGAMSAADKAKLDAATTLATADAIARRDVNGRISVATPSTPGHATTKAYVDGQITALGDQAADYADSAVAAAPAATPSAAGKMSAADKAKLDAATASADASAVVRRDSGGRASFATPTSAGHAATKAFVDTAVAGAKTYADDAVDAVSTICTSTTRPTGGLRYTGQVIYETDTKRTRRWDGAKWQILSQPYTAYDAVWGGFANRGGLAYSQGGEYAFIGPNTVRASAWFRGGPGAILGNSRISVNLPVPADGPTHQYQTGSILPAGPGGVVRPLFGVIGKDSGIVEVWAWPTAPSTLATPGAAGYPFGENAEVHVSVTYQTADVA